MTIETFCTCDFAQDNYGKLTVVGIFDTFNVQALPVVHPLMCIAVRLRLQLHELGNHAIKVDFYSPSGANVLPPFENNFAVNNIGTDTSSINLVLNHMGLKLQEFGKYEVKLSIDGEHKASIPVYVRKA